MEYGANAWANARRTWRFTLAGSSFFDRMNKLAGDHKSKTITDNFDTAKRCRRQIGMKPNGVAYIVAAAVVVFGYLPLTLLGPGTDLDSAGVYQAGRSIFAGSYRPSRRPGSPIYELTVGVLHSLGGTVLVNLASVVMAAVLACAVIRLLDREGSPFAPWLGVAVLVNPFVWIAGTSIADHVWGLGFALVGSNVQRSGRWLPAGLLFGLALGCRLSLGPFVLALWGASWLDRDRESRSKLVRAVLVAVVVTGVFFIPPALTLGRTMFEAGSRSAPAPFVVQVGRAVVKNIYFFGPLAIALVLTLATGIARDLRHWWRPSTTLKAGVLGFVVAELMFLAFPWKLAHLLPAWIALVLVLGSSRTLTRTGVVLLIVSQLLLCMVDLNIAQPDHPGAATGGRASIELLRGPLIRDIDCRVHSDHTDYEKIDGSSLILSVWSCVLPWSDSQH